MLADAEAASREIARFDVELGGEIAPFAAVLLRSESAASSQIENLAASARPGEFRTEPVWIGSGSTPIGATFVGPRHELISEAIGDLIAFAHRVDVPALPQIAVAHAQFETIHPFTDGNGRTGRALIQAMLRNKGLTRQVTVPVSAGLLAHTTAYFAALTTYREGDAAPIVERFS